MDEYGLLLEARTALQILQRVLPARHPKNGVLTTSRLLQSDNGVTYSGPERRDLRGRAAISARLTAALSNPSIVLTVDEAQKLLGVAPDASERILKRLESNGVLEEVQRGEYVPGPLISGIRRP